MLSTDHLGHYATHESNHTDRISRTSVASRQGGDRVAKSLTTSLRQALGAASTETRQHTFVSLMFFPSKLPNEVGVEFIQKS
jgi:hypothetical protein